LAGSLINPSVYDKFLAADDKKPIKIRLRAPLPKQSALDGDEGRERFITHDAEEADSYY
jgi:hypothetical protein